LGGEFLTNRPTEVLIGLFFSPIRKMHDASDTFCKVKQFGCHLSGDFLSIDPFSFMRKKKSIEKDYIHFFQNLFQLLKL
jgi:hypothetical protein